MAFRRLAYHRSWFLIVVGTLGLAPCVALIVDSLMYGNSPDGLDADDMFLLAIGVVLALLVIARGVTGSWSKRQLRVDVRGGKLMLPDGSLRDLASLGALTIEKKAIKDLNPNKRRAHVLHDYLLRAANVEYYLFESNYESETTIRYRAVEAAVLQYRLRQILARPTGDGSVFRSGPDALAEIRAAFPDRDHTLAALDLLAQDGDAHVRDQAAKLATELRQSAVGADT
jgi:hypothetical protein